MLTPGPTMEDARGIRAALAAMAADDDDDEDDDEDEKVCVKDTNEL